MTENDIRNAFRDDSEFNTADETQGELLRRTTRGFGDDHTIIVSLVDILPGQGQGILAQTPATGMPCTPRVVLQGLAGMRVMPTLCYRQAVFPAISSSSILSPSLRIFIAAFRSRSIVKPHLSHT